MSQFEKDLTRVVRPPNELIFQVQGLLLSIAVYIGCLTDSERWIRRRKEVELCDTYLSLKVVNCAKAGQGIAFD